MGLRMHVHFLGEADDGRSISSHHARALGGLGVKVSFSPLAGIDADSSRAADIVHLVTRGPIDPRLLRDILRLQASGQPVARIWTSEDLLWAVWHAPARAVAHGLARSGVRQFCRCQSGADQLASLGIEAAVLPALSLNVSVRSEPQPLPKQLTILCYLPAAKREYYGGDLIDSLARWLPSVRFLALTDEPQQSEAKNLEYLAQVDDLDRSIQRATAILHARLDRTISRLVVEALSHGRHVITGCTFPNTFAAASIDDYLNVIRSLQRDAPFNLAGREEVGRSHDRWIAAEALLRALTNLLEEPDWGGTVRGTLFRAANLLSDAPAEVVAAPDVQSLPPEAHAFRALLRAHNTAPIVDGTAPA
jgi:hypothetical protein